MEVFLFFLCSKNNLGSIGITKFIKFNGICLLDYLGILLSIGGFFINSISFKAIGFKFMTLPWSNL